MVKKETVISSTKNTPNKWNVRNPHHHLNSTPCSLSSL